MNSVKCRDRGNLNQKNLQRKNKPKFNQQRLSNTQQSDHLFLDALKLRISPQKAKK